MKKIIEKLRKFYYFRLANPVIRKGEMGGFKWCFRRFWLDISTLSGNFKARFTADENPYGRLLSAEEDQTHKYSEIVYLVCMLLMTDQKFADSITKAIEGYTSLAASIEPEQEDETVAIEEMKAVQEVVEMDKKARRKYERDVNGRFKKVIRDYEKKAE